MGAINIDNSGSGSSVTLKSDGTSLLLNGTAVGGSSATKVISNQIAAYTVVSGDLGKIINCTSGTFTVSLTAAATLGSGFTCTIWNTSTTLTDAITINPAGAEAIDGVATLILRRGEGLDIVCDGTNWQIDNKKPMRGYVENYDNTIVRSIASGWNSLALGRTSTASGTEAIAIGSYQAVASSQGSIAIGTGTAASALFSLAIGTGSASNGAKSAGAGSIALGGSYASGTDSFAAAIVNNTNTFGAQGTNSIAIGVSARATSTYSIAIGKEATATSLYSTAIGGQAATASGANSLALGQAATASGYGAIAIGAYSLGYALASGTNSVAIGQCTLANITGKYAYAGYRFSADGDSQFGKIVLRAATTTTTAVVLTSDNAAASTTNQLIVATNQAMTFFGTLIAKQSASANMASYMIKGAIVNNAGTVSISTVSVEKLIDTIGLTTEPTYTADNTNKGLAITSGAKLTTNIRWVCNLDSVEVTYA